MPRPARVIRHASLDLPRLASVTALLAIAAIGLRSRTVLSAVSRPAAAAIAGPALVVVFGTVEGAGTLACIALLGLVFRGSRGKRKPEDDLHARHDQQIRWWSRALALLAALAVLVVPIVLLALEARGHQHGSASRSGAAGPAGSPVTGAGHAATGGSSWWLIAGMAAVGVAAGLALFARHRRPGVAEGNRPALLAERLAAATSAGTAALSSHRDPRAAIIACYAAMEGSLASAGSPPAAADTPAEVLGRAFAAGLVRSAAGEMLTVLFRRARYSEHALAEDDRTAALSALAAIRGDLGQRAQPVAEPGSGR